MKDTEIVDLYWSRSEAAIAESARKYGGYCTSIAYNILRSREDSEECVSDTWLRAWNCIPPERPAKLKAFFGRIARNLALNRCAGRGAEKRGGGQVPLALDELRESLPAPEQGAADALALTEALDRFLASLPPKQRSVFLRRYWYFCTIEEIAEGLGAGESQVKSTLARARKKLRAQLKKEGLLS